MSGNVANCALICSLLPWNLIKLERALVKFMWRVGAWVALVDVLFNMLADRLEFIKDYDPC